MSVPTLQQFLGRVESRQRLVSFARRWRFFLIITLGLYGLTLLVSRIFGVLSGWFTPWTLVVPPVAAVILAGIFYHRPRSTDAARLADSKMGTNDLFLTASLIGQTLGSYQDLVLKGAEERATGAQPRKIVPFSWQQDTLRMGAALGILALAVLFLPQWDPFGARQHERQLTEQRDKIHDLAKATQQRAKLLEEKRAGDQADVAKQAVANLEKALQGAKPNDKVGNMEKLNEQQKILGQLWKQTSEEKLKNALNVPPPTQSFGAGDPSKTEQMKTDLQKGDVSSAKKELEDLKKKAEELAATKDPVEREKLKQEMMDRLQSLKDTMDQQLSSQSVDADLQRALEQLAMCNSSGNSSEASKGMGDSMKLTQAELDQLAKAMSDMKNLEEALKTLQMAKAWNSAKAIDGADFANFTSLAEYASLCEGKCKSLIPGNGVGNGLRPGYGYGYRPHGDENSLTGFEPDKAPSPLQPGRMLMEWKTKEVSEAGPAREEYLKAIQDVRQQASEAVVQEQIPPGYQAAIKKYFDTLHNDAPANAQP